MNKIILLIIILFSSGCYAQKLLEILPLKDARVNYSHVFEVEDASIEELNNRANLWLSNSNMHNNQIIYLNDEYQQISSKGSFKELWGPNDYPELYVNVFHTINFKFRKNRYQYEITNFIIKKNGAETQIEIYKMNHKKSMKYNKLFYKRIDVQIKNLITSIEEFMAIPISTEE